MEAGEEYCSQEEFEAMIEGHELFCVLVQLKVKLLHQIAPTQVIQTAPIPPPSIFLGQDLVLDEYMFNSIREYENHLAEVQQLVLESLSTLTPATSKRPREATEDGEAEEASAKRQRTRERLSRPAVRVLMAWLQDNIDNPFPSSEQKQALVQQTGLSSAQINQWFTNARRRVLKGLRESSQATKAAMTTST
jgi:hypothetical protein